MKSGSKGPDEVAGDEATSVIGKQFLKVKLEG